MQTKYAECVDFRTVLVTNKACPRIGRFIEIFQSTKMKSTYLFYKYLLLKTIPPKGSNQPHKLTAWMQRMLHCRNNITTLALYGHGRETILFFSMGRGKVNHFPFTFPS